MIQITNKQNCCGCTACKQRCPKHCIAMKEDEEGFLYPVVDTNQCINCGLCERVCPMIWPEGRRHPLKTYAAKNPNETVRNQSSSGGIFSMLAETVIKEGGMVFGAKWNKNWSVEHGYTETLEGLTAFRGSKYLQSEIGYSYIHAEHFLKEGRKVLFSGTPCQIAGLRKFLRKEYDSLLTVECICHSVPSPGVWKHYLEETCTQLGWKPSDIHRINFRSKQEGWKNYRFELEHINGHRHSENHEHNPYMKGFLAGLYNRPSCQACPTKELWSGADITLGDFWGIGTLLPELDDNRGTSAIVVNTDKGQEILETTSARLHKIPYAELVRRNPAIIRTAHLSPRRATFFTKDGRTFQEKIKKFCRPTMKQRIRRLFSFTLQLLKKLLLSFNI